MAYGRQGEYDKSMADSSEAIRLDPRNAGAHNTRGSLYGMKGDLDRRLADFTEAIRLKPKYDSAYMNRGIIQANKGDFDKAIADFSEAIRINPKCAAAYANRGAAYEKKGDYYNSAADTIRAENLTDKRDETLGGFDPIRECASSFRPVSIKRNASRPGNQLMSRYIFMYSPPSSGRD